MFPLSCDGRATETRLDRVMLTVTGLAGFGALVSLFTGFVLGVTLPGLGVFPRLAWWLLIPCVLLDLCSIRIIAVRRLRGGGPSAIPVISWAYYVLFSLLGLQLDWWWRMAALIGLTLFHACCHWWVPLGIARRLGRKHDASA